MKKHLALVFAALCAFTAFAVTPCVPKDTVLALYVNCGPIARNADAQKLWKSLQEESHCFQDIADGVAELANSFNSDASDTANSDAWNSARFDWAVIALGDYNVKMNSKGKFRIPPFSVTIGGLFEADPFREAVIGDDLESGSVEKIDGLDFAGYSGKELKDESLANFKPCFAVPQDGLFVIGSNKKVLKKTVGLYEGKIPPEPAVSKIFEKSPNGVFAMYADLNTLTKSDIVSAFKMVRMPQNTTDDWLTMLDLFSQIRVYVSVENAKDVHIAFEYVAKGKLANQLRELQKSQADKEFDGAMCEFLETMIAEAGLEDLKLKDLKVSHKGTLMRMEATINAIFLAKLIDAPNEDVNAADDDEEDDE